MSQILGGQDSHPWWPRFPSISTICLDSTEGGSFSQHNFLRHSLPAKQPEKHTSSRKFSQSNKPVNRKPFHDIVPESIFNYNITDSNTTRPVNTQTRPNRNTTVSNSSITVLEPKHKGKNKSINFLSFFFRSRPFNKDFGSFKPRNE